MKSAPGSRPRWATSLAMASATLLLTFTCPTGSQVAAARFTTAPLDATVGLVNPPSGPIAGGTAVTITGSGFATGATLSFGGEPATAVVVVNANTITAVAPAHAAGTVDVRLAVPGSPDAILVGGYRYVVPTTEPNDTFATAVEVPFGTTAGLTYVPTDEFDADWYKFYVPPPAAGQDVRVNLRVTSPYPNPLPSGFRSDLDYEVLNAAGQDLAVALSGTDNETLDLHAVTSGWYYIYLGYLGFNDATQIPTYAVTLTLGPPPGVGWVTGRAVNPSGQPMPGVFVRLQTYPYNHNVTFPIVTTAADGTFWAAHAPGLHDVQFTGRNVSNVVPDVNVEEEYFFDRLDLGDHFTVAVGESVSLGTVTLQSGAVFEGRVTDSTGAPVQMATVVANRPGTTLNLSVFTDVDGYYTLMGVPAGGATLRFGRSGYATEYYPDQASMGTATVLPTAAGQITTINAQLGPGGTVSGFVKTPSASAVAATVRLYAAGDSVYSRASATSSASTGGFSFNGVLPGQYVLEFFPSGTPCLPEWWENATSFATATRITVVAGQAVSGLQAVLTDTGTPAPTVTQVVPASGPLTGGTPVTITGTGFVSGAQVHFGGIPATAVVVVSPTTITATSPARTPGLAEVRVTNSSGVTGRLASAFSFDRLAPTLTWTTPAPIPAGSHLDSRQLNALASYDGAPLQGTFEYTPPAGTPLEAGVHTLWTRFVPLDSSLYAVGLRSTIITVAESGSLAVGPATLNFGGSLSGGVVSPVTPPQTVMVTYTGTGAPVWTASADQPWVQLAAATGVGSGQFTAGIANPGNVLAGVTDATATITVAAPGAGNSPQTVAVHLSLRAPSASAPPLGQVDAPAQNATGVQGTIGITGWVVDDVGVDHVRIYRNCLVFEPAVNCAPVAGRDALVYVGDATIVSGARPDVEAVFATYPQAYQAAWGYLLMTNLLPHVPGQQMFGGQGPLTFHVLATDVEGKTTWLGRTTTDTTPTTFTMANDTIAKPFGAIDTPGQGALTTGAFWNFGWALTPDSNTVADGTDILMPTSGGTMWVYIDGVPQGTVTYDMCRGTTPMPTYCDDDIASIFGHATPQPVFTPRTGNATAFRNLDAGRGAIAARYTDTTLLANGIHTIAWGVTDSASRGEGIGSRYFWVLNSGGREADDPSFVGAGYSQPQRDVRLPSTTLGASKPDATNTQPDATRTRPHAATGEVFGRTGFNLDVPFVPLALGETGAWQIGVTGLGRLELQLGPVDAGYLVANGELRSLPSGSTLDPETGVFSWTPGVGYVGVYDLVFLRGGQQIRVAATIGPAASR